MKYLTYGDKRKKSIVLIHGMATTAKQCYERILPYLDYYYVVLVQVDGHIEGETSCLESVDDACTDIENYINTELGGEVFCLSGFSMGGTMAVEIAGRGNVKIEKLYLDAAWLTQLNPGKKNMYKKIFWGAIKWLQMGLDVPDFLIDAIMGEDNRAAINMLYTRVSKKTIMNACEYVYSYSIPEGIRNFAGDTMFIYGQNEPYPRRSAQLLKSFLPSLQINELYNFGHGQFLYEQPEKYTNMLLDFIEGNAGCKNATISGSEPGDKTAINDEHTPVDEKSHGVADVSNHEKLLSNVQVNKDNLLQLKCEQCGAPLELDMDNLLAFCPHCGSKLIIDVADIQKFMIEKEQSKRQEKRYEHELEVQKLENENDKAFWLKAVLIVALFFIVFILVVVFGRS